MAAAVLIYECAIASVVLQGAAGAVKRRATFSAQLEAQRDSVCYRLRAAEHAPISKVTGTTIVSSSTAPMSAENHA